MKTELEIILQYLLRLQIMFDYNTYECNRYSTVRYVSIHDYIIIEIMNNDSYFYKRKFYLFKNKFEYQLREEKYNKNSEIVTGFNYDISTEELFQHSLIEDIADLDVENISILKKIREIVDILIKD